jgi:hypothetical protein
VAGVRDYYISSIDMSCRYSHCIERKGYDFARQTLAICRHCVSRSRSQLAHDGDAFDEFLQLLKQAGDAVLQIDLRVTAYKQAAFG